MRPRIWLPFDGEGGSYLPGRVLLTGCQLPVGSSKERVNWHLAAVWQFPINIFLSLQTELASGCQLPIYKNVRIDIWRPFAYLPKIVLNPLKSNWHLAASCQLPIRNYARIGIWEAFAGFLITLNCLKSFEIGLASSCHLPISWLPEIVLNPLKSNWHLAAFCRLPIRKYVRICIWLPFADFLITLNCLKTSEIELSSGCQFPVANSHE